MEEELNEGSLPENTEAERALLGGLLLDNSKVDEVLNILKSDDFYDPKHKVIYQSIVELVELGKPIDRIILKDHLEKNQKLDFIGGDIYLTILLERDAAPPTVIPDLAQQIKEKSILRNLIKTAKIIETKAKISKNIDELIEEAEKLIFDITNQKTTTPYYSLNEVLKTTLDIINELYKKDTVITGIPTGFYELDKKTTGLHRGDLIIIAARPAMGKTSFALSILHHISVKENIPAAFFSLEMSKEQIVMRLLCNEAKIPLKKVRAGFLNKDELNSITEAALNMAKAPLFIDDTASLTILDLRAKARRLKKEKDIGLIVIDYLQLLKSHRRIENRQQEVAEISRSLKALAKELEIPIVSLAQLSRQTEIRADKRPQLADLRESGSIEQDADIVMFIHRPEYYKKNPTPEEEGLAEIIIAKQRNGPTGTVDLAFIKEITKFENLAKTTPDTPLEEEILEEFSEIDEVDI
ncbi:MAG: replicative DNA helicase [Aquificae bacterium]|nr:replicative DNA helicase [Aquificota bacterium]